MALPVSFLLPGAVTALAKWTKYGRLSEFCVVHWSPFVRDGCKVNSSRSQMIIFLMIMLGCNVRQQKPPVWSVFVGQNRGPYKRAQLYIHLLLGKPLPLTTADIICEWSLSKLERRKNMGGRHLTLCAIPHPPTMSDYGGETFYGAPVEIVGGHPNVTLKKLMAF